VRLSEAALPPVTVVVLARNRRAKLETTLNVLTEGVTYPAEQLELIVVDNASSDGTTEMVQAQFPSVTLVSNERNVGIAGWKCGLARGSGEYFLLLDDDCYLEGDSLVSAVGLARAERADLVSFRVLSTVEPGHVFNDDYHPGLLAFWGCAALLSRRAVATLGGFDPAIFVFAHEPEFTMRLLDQGLRHLYAPEITAHHMSAPAQRLTPRFYKLHLRNLAYTAAKLLQPRDAAPVLANLAMTAFLWTLVRPQMVRCVPGVFSGARAGLRCRSPVSGRVSHLYRSDFVDFVSPFRFIRSPRIATARAERRRFWSERPALYPTEMACLEL
jgi:GT2 family glycosyltransferase